MGLPELAADELHVLVFGPGIGELVLLRAPPGDWLVIDGCSASSIEYGPRVLEHYDARPRLILFTHPHLDHARGVATIVDDLTSGDQSEWPRIGMLPLFHHIRRLPSGVSPATDYQEGVVEHAVSTILDRWERASACRWDARDGSSERLGSAVVTVISPDASIVRRAETKLAGGKQVDWNTLSSAVLVEWEGVRVVLGSDLVERPLKGWSRVARSWGARVLPHNLSKLPHHGASKAVHPTLLREGSAIVTPFAVKSLPRFSDEGGVAQYQRGGLMLALTGLPRKHDTQSGAVPQIISRSDLAADPDVWFDPITPGFPDCYVCASFSPQTSEASLTFGPGSVRIT